MVISRLLLLLVLATGLAACGSGQDARSSGEDEAAPHSSAATATTLSAMSSAGKADARLAAFFQRAFEARIARSPMRQSYLGIKTDYDKWDDIGDDHAAGDIALVKEQLAELRANFDPDALSPRMRLSRRLFIALGEREIANARWRHHSYPVNQMFGWQQQIPSFLINIHRVADRADLEAYIARLRGVSGLIDQLIEQLRIREQSGILPPRFVYPIVLRSARNVISGVPFEVGRADSTLWADFRKKLASLDLPQVERERLSAAARDALVHRVGPAYAKLIAVLEEEEKLADERDGVWKLPDGAAYYQSRLRQYTTTDLSADQIHEIGLGHVARIHGEMREIMKKVGFKGTLSDFFRFMREDPRFYYPDTEEGRAAYLKRANEIIASMKARLPSAFGLLPKADLVVKRVEPFRERAAGKAFYQQPALDGSRPGTYYVNLYRMADMPTYQMEALAYHEGVPGHHMQIAIAQELDGVPMFQRLARFTAYTEGWGLYAEYLPKEMGFYVDPYSDFGRLAMELWRAVRLVVDTGIHAKKWTREQAIAYHLENTPNPKGDIVKAVERYIIMPGQATAYMIGKERILALREKAREALGERFDLAAYHDTVLENGPLPLDILEEQVDAWIAGRQELR